MANTSGERSETILVVVDCDIVLDVFVATLNTFVVFHADSGGNALNVPPLVLEEATCFWPLCRCLECPVSSWLKL
jgi:hypothetical protein